MKNVLKITAVICVLLALMCNSALAAFTDMPEGEAGAVIERAVANGLLTGFEDSTFRPNDPITRAQIATIISRVFNPKYTADISSYTDVAPTDWHYDAMSRGVAMGAFQGSYNLLNPNQNITRQEAVIVLARIFDLPEASLSALASLTDSTTIATWAKLDVARVVAGGYIETTGRFRPTEPMTRLEFATVMDKLVTTYITVDGEYNAANFPKGNVLIKANNVSLSGITSDDVVFVADGVQGKVTFTDCNLERVIVRGGESYVNSGSYGQFRVIGYNAKAYLHKMPQELIKKYPDGSTGLFYGKPGYGNIEIMPFYDVEIE